MDEDHSLDEEDYKSRVRPGIFYYYNNRFLVKVRQGTCVTRSEPEYIEGVLDQFKTYGKYQDEKDYWYIGQLL